MLFATLLIAAVCAQDNEKTVKTLPKSKVFTLKDKDDRDILSKNEKIELLILRNFNETSKTAFLEPLSNPYDVCYPDCSKPRPKPALGGNGQNKSDKQESSAQNYKRESSAQNYKQELDGNKSDKRESNVQNYKRESSAQNYKQESGAQNNKQESGAQNNKQESGAQNNKQESDAQNYKRRNLGTQTETISRTEEVKNKYKIAMNKIEDAVYKNMLGISAKAKEYTAAKKMAAALGELFPEKFNWPQSNSGNEDENNFFNSLEKTFGGDKLQSPAGDYNLRIVEKEEHCIKQAQHFPQTFAANFTKDKWARYNALDEKILTPFKEKANFLRYFKSFSETIKYDTFWDDITTDDYLEEDKLKELAEAGCEFKKIREIFKENASDFTGHGNSVASFGLSAILALAVFGL